MTVNPVDSTAGWYLNAAARLWRMKPLGSTIREFHRSLPGYAPTPLVSVPEIAAMLNVGFVFVKDESQRLGLPAFKILGASYAISRALSARLDVPGVALQLEELRDRLGSSSPLSLAAATDGNHGRAVAHVANLLGLPATIYVPDGVSQAAKDAIVGEGATLVVLDLPYDDVVQHAKSASVGDVVLIQDTAWSGYTDIPQAIVDGYDTMFAEVDDQLREMGIDHIDLVVAPSGVGSFAQAVVAHYRSTENAPAVLSVEPETASSVTTSLNAGQLTSVSTADTIMTGLNCGTVSEIAWPILQAGLDSSVTISDRQAFAAVHELAQNGVDSGPCGASTLAGAHAVLADADRRAALSVAADAVIVLLSTEGRAANPKGLVANA
ncbi:diaminopropionate ammonia-lyase [Salinibacterium sp. M195]|uniref:diaminopropionate ammonia-lyase n=1 Tax=Salinibacterium sp. M195 TaxID=2583374 RepID=UPI001C634BD3|nr:diaminopropionate ammonia-lyase [Salinibacterium sp. M195]QYH36345.1 diaminopropionate ammonia-lyase [Salinibacterium sp. M195]